MNIYIYVSCADTIRYRTNRNGMLPNSYEKYSQLNIIGDVYLLPTTRICIGMLALSECIRVCTSNFYGLMFVFEFV